LRHVGHYYVTLFLHRELISRAKLCLVGVFPDIVKDCPKIRNLAKKFWECGPRSRVKSSALWVCSPAVHDDRWSVEGVCNPSDQHNDQRPRHH